MVYQLHLSYIVQTTLLKLLQLLAYTTDYTVTVTVNGTVLTSTFNRTAFTEARVLSVDVVNRKITLDGAGTFKILDSVNLSFEEAKGRTIRVWHNDKNEVSKYAFDTKETVIYAPISLDKADEITVLPGSQNYKLDNTRFQF